MPTAFDRAAAVLFGNADLAAAATLYPGGNFTLGVPVSVILSRADQDSEFGENRVRGVQTIVSVLVADAQDLAKGDVLIVGADTFRLAEAPERDAARTRWTASVSKEA